MIEKEKKEQSQGLFTVRSSVDYLGGSCDNAKALLLGYTVDLVSNEPTVYAKVSYYIEMDKNYLFQLTMRDGTKVRTINCLNTEPNIDAIKEYISKV